VWLDPLRVEQMARSIASALIERDPEGAAEYRHNAGVLGARASAAHARLREQLSARAGQTLLTYHPAYGHFAARYGLVQLAIEEDGREPGPRHLAEVLAAARREQVVVLLVQPQHPRRSAEAVARELGIPTLEIDPLDRDVETTWSLLADAVARERPGSGGSQ
jgi:zinc transport system substrate-binding protein